MMRATGNSFGPLSSMLSFMFAAPRGLSHLALSLALAVVVVAAEPADPAAGKRRPEQGRRPTPEAAAAPIHEAEAVGPVMGENKATPVSRLKVPDGFKVELVYSVPGGEQGSWVNLCTDAKGRIIASDQYGGLYRFSPPALGQVLEPAKIECPQKSGR